MKALTAEAVSAQLSSDELINLIEQVAKLFGKPFQIQEVHRVNGKATVSIQVNGIGSRIVNL